MSKITPLNTASRKRTILWVQNYNKFLIYANKNKKSAIKKATHDVSRL